MKRLLIVLTRFGVANRLKGGIMLRFNAFLVIVVFVFLTLNLGTAMSAPISYDETADGDLPHNGAGPYAASAFLAVDVGTNTFTGTTTTTPPGGTSDFDIALFSIPSDLQVTNVAASFSVNNTEKTYVSRLGIRLSGFEEYTSTHSVDEIVATGQIDSFPFTGSVFTSDLPIVGFGYYGVDVWSFERVFEGGEGSLPVDYTWELTVVPSNVPIPGAVWLLGSGLVGLVGLRRKLKK